MTILHVFQSYGRRLMRFFAHTIPFVNSHYKLKSIGLLEWVIDLMFYISDILLIPDFYELVNAWIKRETRLLNTYEKNLARSVFINSIDLRNVRVNAKMSKYYQKLAKAYVSFHTINFNEDIPQATFIHELVHVWQYQNYGSMYIYRALKAQRSKEGYDYGGVEGLYAAMIEKKKFTDFNFEQQGDIIEDWFRMGSKVEVTYGQLGNAAYIYYLNELKSIQMKSN